MSQKQNCAGSLGQSSQPPQSMCESMLLPICGSDLVEGKAGDGFHPGRCGFAFEAGGAAPPPLEGQRHEAVMTRVLMHIVQPRQIALRVGEVRLTIVCHSRVQPGVPSSAFRRFVVRLCIFCTTLRSVSAPPGGLCATR